MSKRFGQKELRETVDAKNRTVLVSYQEPVVVVEGPHYFVTQEKFSKTTSRHINFYLRERGAESVHYVDPQTFRRLVRGEI